MSVLDQITTAPFISTVVLIKYPGVSWTVCPTELSVANEEVFSIRVATGVTGGGDSGGFGLVDYPYHRWSG